ncbi:MAG: hypothetical protein J0H82_26100 [Alphaproteobacteria bacterium]|jgi:hypothetical protein|nr:hypothetical protein [Alphaproteobacteria bacterium]
MLTTPTRKRRSAAKSADTEAVVRGPIVDEPAPLPDMAEISRHAMAAIKARDAVVGEVFDMFHVSAEDEARAARAQEAADNLLAELIGTQAMTAEDLVNKAAVLWPAAFEGVQHSTLDRNQRLAAAVALDAALLVGRVVDGDTLRGRLAGPVQFGTADEITADDLDTAFRDGIALGEAISFSAGQQAPGNDHPPIVPGRGPNAHLPGVGDKAALPEAFSAGTDAMLLADAAEVVRLKAEAERLAKAPDAAADDAAVAPMLDEAAAIEARVVSAEAGTLAGVLAKVRVLKAWVDDHETVNTVTQVAGILRDLEAITAREPAVPAVADPVTPALAALCAAALAACEVLAPFDQDKAEDVDGARETALVNWDRAMHAASECRSASHADVIAKLELSARCARLLGYERGEAPPSWNSSAEGPAAVDLLENAALRDLAALMPQPDGPASAHRPTHEAGQDPVQPPPAGEMEEWEREERDFKISGILSGTAAGGRGEREDSQTAGSAYAVSLVAHLRRYPGQSGDRMIQIFRSLIQAGEWSNGDLLGFANGIGELLALGETEISYNCIARPAPPDWHATKLHGRMSPPADHALTIAARFRDAYAAYWAEERGLGELDALPAGVLDELDTARNLLIWATPTTAEGFLQVAAALQMGAMPPKFPADGEQDEQFAWAIARMARDLTGAES